MASVKSVDDMLFSDIDESAVNALAGSLESQLSAPVGVQQYTRVENSASFGSDTNLRTLAPQKHGVLIGNINMDHGNANSNKSFTTLQPMCVSQVPLSNSVMVSTTANIQVGGYINNTYAQAPQEIKYQTSSANSAAQYTRNNLKLQNGSSNVNASVTSSGLLRNGPACGQNSQGINNVPTASSPCNFQTAAVPTQHQNAMVPQTLQSVNPSNMNKFAVKDSPNAAQNNFIMVDQQQLTAASAQHNNFQATNSSAKVNQSPPVSVMAQIMSNQQQQQSIQVVNVNSTRFGQPSIQRALAPRVVISNQMRLQPQMIRQGLPVAVPGQNAIAIPPGLRGTIFVKTENGQLQVVNVQPGVPNSSMAMAYRLQSVHPGVTTGMRAIVPQNSVKIPVSTADIKTTIQGNTRTLTPQSITSTVLKQSVAISSTAVPRNKVPTQGTAQGSTAKMSPETVKEKCTNFLTTLVKLAADQPKRVGTNVKKLIQGLIDGTVTPEDFTTRLQKELNSSPQPCLLPFLKRSLPYLRYSLYTKEVTIQGVNPPPMTAYMMPTYATTQPSQVNQLRPVLTPTLSTANSSVASILTSQLSQHTPGTMVLSNQSVNSTQVTRSLLHQSIAKGSVSPMVTGMSTVQSKLSSSPRIYSKPILAAKDKKAVTTVRDEDDINDVAAMGGVNLIEESQKILATNSELIGTQIRSCKDDNYLLSGSLELRIAAIARRHGIPDVASDAIALISHAAQERLKTLIEKLNIVAEHRTENIKMDLRYEVSHDVRCQVKFLEELERLEKKKHEEQEREILMRAAKSRSKVEDPEQLKLKQKAKEMQKAEIEELRQKEANMTALLAIGPRKRQKTDSSPSGVGMMGLNSLSGGNIAVKPQMRPRVKRVNFRDLLFVMEQEHRPSIKLALYKSHVK